jgi:putative DNA primase/helicase
VITETTGILTPVPANIPEELKIRPQWIVWRPERTSRAKLGELTKVPYCPATHLRADTTDLMTWCSFENAWGAYEDSDRRYSGIGFVFSSGDPFTFIDLDGCRRPSGEVARWAQEIIDRAADVAYVEASVSGSGVHIILEAKARGSRRKRGPIEVYSQERYACVSGVLL